MTKKKSVSIKEERKNPETSEEKSELDAVIVLLIVYLIDRLSWLFSRPLHVFSLSPLLDLLLLQSTRLSIVFARLAIDAHEETKPFKH